MSDVDTAGLPLFIVELYFEIHKAYLNPQKGLNST